jgi:hypothetical protein
MGHGSSLHRLLSSAHAVSVLGRVYLLVGLSLLMLGVFWGTLTLIDNRGHAEVVILVPRLALDSPLRAQRYLVDVSVLVAGWGVACGVVLLWAIRAPFRVRAVARSQRRMRDLEREILDLRTLPLRSREEDDILAAEAHLDARPRKVMTEKLRREGTSRGSNPSPPPGDAA